MGLLKQTAKDYYSGNDLGDYQFVSLENIISNFMISYVGEGKIIPKVKRTDVLFHAKRALQELSYDTLKSIKSQEITLPPSLVMPLPQDYINYVKLTWSDSGGIEHIIYPVSKTSNPLAVQQGYDDNYTFNSDLELAEQTGTTLTQSSEVFTSPSAPFSLSLLDSSGSYVTNPTESVSVGMAVTGEDVPLGTYITSFNGTAIIINQAIPIGTYDITFTLSNKTIQNTTTDGTTFAILSDSNSNIAAGMLVFGENVPSNTIITSISGVAVKFNKAIPANATGVLNYVSKSTVSDTWSNYKSTTPSGNRNNDYEDGIYWPSMGGRYGLDPQQAHVNGSFYIDEVRGEIHFSSNISGETVPLKYISDSLGTDAEMQVHKFAEEAMYKWIAYAIASTTISGQAIAPMLKKERFAETRKAKLRMSNLKIEELTQIMRGKSKFLKH